MGRPRDLDTPEGRQRHEEKYGRILKAALQVFAAKGFHEAKISEIARVAGVADGTIYLYFKNKDDILLSVFEAELEAINNGLRQSLEQLGSASEKLERAIRYHLAIPGNDPPVAQFITVELRRSSKFMKDYAKAQLREYLDHFESLFQEGIASGEFRGDLKPGMMAQLLFGALDYACLTWVNNPNREAEDLTDVAEFVVDLMARAVKA